MSLRLHRFGLAGAARAPDTAPPPPPAGLEAWVLLQARAPSGYNFYLDGRQAVNDTGGSDYRAHASADRFIDPAGGPVYWEVALNSAGPAEWNGYVGLVGGDAWVDLDASENPIRAFSVGWRGIGQIWADGSNQSISVPTYGPDDVLIFAFDPAARDLWLGKNGTWVSSPLVDPPQFTLPAGVPAFAPSLQGRDPGQGLTLRTLPSDFSWPVPSGARALAFVPDDLSVSRAALIIEFDVSS